MKQLVLFVILDQFADWEYSFLATALQDRIMDKTSPYEVKTVSAGKDPILSLGGFTVLPDYAAGDSPADYAGLALIGGTSWRTEKAQTVLPLLTQAFQGGRVVGAICDATVFLGMNGFLNDKQHTSNTREDLEEAAGGATPAVTATKMPRQCVTATWSQQTVRATWSLPKRCSPPWAHIRPITSRTIISSLSAATRKL